MTISRRALRKTANTVKRKVEKAERERFYGNKLNRSVQKKRAARIIADIPKLLEETAEKGEYSTRVMELETNDFDPPLGYKGLSDCKIDDLIGAAKLVRAYCTGKGLTTKLDYYEKLGMSDTPDRRLALVAGW